MANFNCTPTGALLKHELKAHGSGLGLGLSGLDYITESNKCAAHVIDRIYIMTPKNP